jgi:hypothetical protein
MGYREAALAVERARRLATWVKEDRLPRAFLHAAATLHAGYLAWFTSTARREVPDGRVRRFVPLLAYQAQRNLRDPEARSWGESLRRSDSREWPFFDVIATYVALATREESREEEL